MAGAAYFFRFFATFLVFFLGQGIKFLPREGDFGQLIPKTNRVQPIAVVRCRNVDTVAEDIVLVFIFAVRIVVLDMNAFQLCPRPEQLAFFPVRRAAEICSIACLDQFAHSLIVELFGIGQRMYGDIRLKAVCPLPHFPTNIFPLPCRPVRNVAKFRLSLLRGELGKRIHLPGLFAGIAPKAGALGVHHKFLAAMRALV